MPAVVQHRNTFSASATSVALAFASNNAAGNLLAYITGVYSSSTISAATDNNTNTIANALAFNSGTDGNDRVDYVANSNAGANTATGHQSATQPIHLHLYEISGCATASPVRETGTANSATASVSTTGTTALSGDAVLGYFFDFASNATLVQGTGYTPSELSADAGGGDASLSEYKSATAGGTQTATCTGNGTDPLTQVIVVFKQAAGGSTPKLFLPTSLSGLGSGGPFFHDRLAN